MLLRCCNPRRVKITGAMVKIQKVSIQIAGRTFYRCAIPLHFILAEEGLFHIATSNSSEYLILNTPKIQAGSGKYNVIDLQSRYFLFPLQAFGHWPLFQFLNLCIHSR
jgi:hypothetical protein